MLRFSRRYGFTKGSKGNPILEDAPSELRDFYIDGILDGLIYIDRDSRFASEGKPLGVKALYEGITFHIRVPKTEEYWDSAYCTGILYSLIRVVPWYHFYDVVEFVGKQLKEVKDDVFEDVIDSFSSYRSAVNEFFEESGIGYRLNEQSELHRELPSPLSKRVKAGEEQLVDKYAPARSHYQKAERYIYQAPVDPENSIKEIVSAVESVGRLVYPNANTLGEVVKELRKAEHIPTMLTAIIEKFYAFASAEPAIRHGGTRDSSISVHEAEFCLHTGIALIRYLIAKQINFR